MNKHLTAYEKINFKFDSKIMSIGTRPPVVFASEEIETSFVKKTVERFVENRDMFMLCAMYSSIVERIDMFTHLVEITDQDVQTAIYNNYKKNSRKYRSFIKTMEESLYYYTGDHFYWKIIKIVVYCIKKHASDAIYDKLTNRGNFKQVLHNLGIKPIVVKRNTALSFIVEYWIFKGPELYSKTKDPSIFWTHFPKVFGLDHTWLRSSMDAKLYNTYFPRANQTVVFEASGLKTGFDDDDEQDEDLQHVIELQKKMWEKEDIEVKEKVVYTAFEGDSIANIVNILATLRMTVFEIIPDLLKAESLKDFGKRIINGLIKLSVNRVITELLVSYMDVFVGFITDIMESVKGFITTSNQEGPISALNKSFTDDAHYHIFGGKYETAGWSEAEQKAIARKLAGVALPACVIAGVGVNYIEMRKRQYSNFSVEEQARIMEKDINEQLEKILNRVLGKMNQDEIAYIACATGYKNCRFSNTVIYGFVAAHFISFDHFVFSVEQDKILTLFCVQLEQYIANSINFDNGHYFESQVLFARKLLEDEEISKVQYNAFCEFILRQPKTQQQIHKHAILDKVVLPTAVNTDYMDVFKALKNSECATLFKSVIMTLKFSALISAACGKLGLEHVKDLVIPVFESFLYESQNIINLTNLWSKLCSEVLPALYYADPKYITPSFYGTKLSVMYKAIACMNTMDLDQMELVSCEWRGVQRFDEVNVLITFHDVVGEMIVFLEKSINAMTASGIKSLLNQLSQLHLSLKNKLKFGLTRSEPLCICLYGLPGVGKTTFYPEIMYELSEVLDLPKHINAKGQYVVDEPAIICTTDKFLDNVTNYHKTYVLDDIGQADPAKDTAPNLFTHFMDIQANVCKPIPKSFISGKSDNYFNNKLTIITTNFNDCGCKFYIREPDAFMRRIHIHVQMLMIDKNDREAGMRYRVGFLNLQQRTRYHIEYENKEEFFRGIKLYATTYKQHQSQYLAARTFTFCPTCNNKTRSCTCHIVRQAHVSEMTHGLWFIPSQSVFNLTVHQIFSMMVCEEFIMQFLFFVLHSYINLNMGEYTNYSYYVLLFISMVVREVIEVVTTYGHFDYKRFFFLGHLVAYPLPLAIALHTIYNAYIFSPPVQDVRLMCESHIDHYAGLVTKRVKNYLTPVWFTELQIKYQKVIDYKRVIADDAVRLLTSSYGVPMGLATMLGLIYYVFSEHELIGKVTALGDPPTEEDVAANVSLRSMVQGNYISQLDDKANSYKTGVEVVVRKRAGNLPNVLHKNVVIMQTKLPLPLTFTGFWTNGQVITVYHPLAKFFRLNPDIHFTVEFWFEKTPHEKYSVSLCKDNLWTKFTHDVISFPHFVKDRNSCPIMYSYECGKNDRFMVRGDLVPLIGKATAFNTELGTEPAGNILIDYQSKVGFSGSPVFLVERDGQEIQPVLIGVLSAMFETKANTAVVSPLVPCINNTALEILPELITPDLVKYAFQEYKPIHDGVDPKGILKHVDDCTGIGEHIGHCDRHVNHSKTAFKRTEFYEKAVELIPATAEFDFVTLEPKVVDGVYQNCLLGAARQMAACGEHMNQAPAWSASVMITEWIWEQIGDQLQYWEPMSVLDALKGTLITNPIKRSTAVGFPFSGMIKDEVFVGSYEDPMFVKWYADRIAKLIDNMDKGIPPLNVASSSLKDEILKKGKMTRVFFAGNMDFLVLCRIYLGALMEMFMSNRDKLFAQIGMNAIGSEFDKFLRTMYERIYGPITDLQEFLTKAVWVDSDFEKYDKLVNTLKFAIHIIYWLALKTKFFKQNPKELNRLKLVLSSLMNFVVILGKDIFIFRDKIPSGVWATTMIGCLCEVIIEVLQLYFLIYVSEYGIDAPALDFVALYKNKIPFFKHVSLGNYGDDNLKVLSALVKAYYTHDNIKLFGVWIHMGMTPARKHEKMIEVKPVTDILFLKRVPVYNTFLKRLVGRLEIASIGKMLAFTDSVSPDWKRSVLDQARRELAFHNIEIYDKFFSLFNLEYVPIEDTLAEIDSVVWGSKDTVPVIDLFS